MGARDAHRRAHMRRLSWMPWLWDRLKPHQRAWAEPWQAELQRELAEVERSVTRLGSELTAWRSVSVPFGPTSIVDGILAGLPGSVTLDRLSFDADSLVTPSGRSLTARSDRAAVARRVKGELEGFAATDEDVVSLVTSLRSVPFFMQVTVERTWHLDLDGDSARAFRLGFEVDLEAASPTPKTPERAEDPS